MSHVKTEIVRHEDTYGLLGIFRVAKSIWRFTRPHDQKSTTVFFGLQNGICRSTKLDTWQANRMEPTCHMRECIKFGVYAWQSGNYKSSETPSANIFHTIQTQVSVEQNKPDNFGKNSLTQHAKPAILSSCGPHWMMKFGFMSSLFLTTFVDDALPEIHVNVCAPK